MLHVVLKEMDRWHMVSSSISNASSQFHKTLFFSPLKHSNIRLSTCKSIDIIFYFQRRFVNIKIWNSMDFSHVLLLKNIYIIEVRYYNIYISGPFLKWKGKKSLCFKGLKISVLLRNPLIMMLYGGESQTVSINFFLKWALFFTADLSHICNVKWNQPFCVILYFLFVTPTPNPI